MNDSIDEFYEKLSAFNCRQNKRWNEYITREKEYISYEEFLFNYCDEDFEIDDPRYIRKVIVANGNEDICDLL